MLIIIFTIGKKYLCKKYKLILKNHEKLHISLE